MIIIYNWMNNFTGIFELSKKDRVGFERQGKAKG